MISLDLTAFNSYAIQATASRCYFPHNQKELTDSLLSFRGTPPIILGGGTNVLLMSQRYTTPVLILTALNRTIICNGTYVEVGAGVSLATLVEFANSRGLAGLERLVGIPGTVGGAIRMNAGAYGQDIGGVLEWVETIDINSTGSRVWSKDEIGLSYRSNAIATEPVIITRAALRFKNDSTIPLQEQSARLLADSRHYLLLRAQKIPYHLPNAGSVFKRPSHGKPVGAMVETIGLKGHAINDAMISREHGGIIVNTGLATGADVAKLIELMRVRINEHFNVQVELEQVKI